MPARWPTCRAGLGPEPAWRRVADDDFVDFVGGTPGPLERRARGDRAELGRMDVLERAAVAADRRARRTKNHDIARGHKSLSYQTIVQIPTRGARTRERPGAFGVLVDSAPTRVLPSSPQCACSARLGANSAYPCSK